VKSNLPEGIEFTRYVICKAAAKLLGESPLMVARERYPDNPRIQVMLKAAVAGGTTSDSTWAAPLASTAQTLTSEFLNYLRPRTIVGRFGTNGIPSLTRVPFNSRIQSQTSGGVAAWVGQGIQKPVTKFAFDAATLTWAKIAAISVLSDELIRFSTPSAETRVRDSLVNVIVERLDRDFIDPDKSASANVSPASITNGLAGLTPSTGGDATDVRTDVAAALGVFIDADQDPTDLVWIMSATSALQLSLMRNALGNREFPDITVNGGTFEGFPVIVSQYCAKVGSPTQNCVVLVKASEIFLADDGGVTVDLSTEASIEMSDDPANDSGTVVSMYQTNQVALRAERFINWSRGRTSSVAWLDGVAWSASA
jgi:HK97 family phage major capsid protein